MKPPPRRIMMIVAVAEKREYLLLLGELFSPCKKCDPTVFYKCQESAQECRRFRKWCGEVE